MDKLILIDGNSIMNRAFYGIMSSKMLTTSDGTYTNAVYGFLSIMFKIMDDLNPKYLVVAFDVKSPTKRHEMYKDYKGTVIFPKGNVKIDMRSAKASKHVHMLEQTYERTAIRVDDRTIANGNYLDTLNTDNIAYLHKRTEGGFSINVLNEILADLKAEGKFFVRNFTDKKQIENALNLYSGNPRYIINESHWASPTSGHAISIRKYDPVTRKVTIADPNNSSIQTEMDLDEMFKNIKNITVGQIA